MKPLLGSVLLAGLLLVCPCGARATQAPRASTVKRGKPPCPSQSRYYILTKATLISDESVSVFGASNLPLGSVLTVYVSSYIGEGGETLNHETDVPVGKDGLFSVIIHPKKGLQFRTNMICQVSFWPDDRSQPANVVRAVGRRGQYLGTNTTNPEVYTYPQGTILVDDTFVTE